MHWNNFEEFLAMGGYAFFVWGAVGVTVLAMVVEILTLQARRHHLKFNQAPASQRIGTV